MAAGLLAYLFSDWVDERFELPETALVDLGGEDPECAARSLREEWQLGERPIRDVVRLLESKGVRMFSLAEQTRTLDAFFCVAEHQAAVCVSEHHEVSGEKSIRRLP